MSAIMWNTFTIIADWFLVEFTNLGQLRDMSQTERYSSGCLSVCWGQEHGHNNMCVRQSAFVATV
eukprot:1833467-Amphidinium_carterae.1